MNLATPSISLMWMNTVFEKQCSNGCKHIHEALIYQVEPINKRRISLLKFYFACIIVELCGWFLIHCWPWAKISLPSSFKGVVASLNSMTTLICRPRIIQTKLLTSNCVVTISCFHTFSQSYTSSIFVFILNVFFFCVHLSIHIFWSV